MRKKLIAICLLAVQLFVYSCNFFQSITGDIGSGDNINIDSLMLSKKTLSLEVGAMDYITVSIKPTEVQKKVKLHWSYDESIIECDTSSPWGITITAIKEGKTQLKCSYNGYDAVCMITVSGFAPGYESMVEPYIYSNTTILTTAPGVSERVFVSLYGGNAADIDGYNWTIDNPSVATINPSGQYCLITAKESGYTRIKVTHNKSAYPYYIGVYVFAETTNIPYITTSNNIITMNQADSAKTISCSMVNGKDTSLDSSFRWEILNLDNSEIPVQIETINNQAVITPIRNGSCTIRVTHPDAIYPLDILCRVITIVQNVYIEPDQTIKTISGDTTEVITANLIGLKEGEYNIDEYTYSLNRNDVAEIVSSVGNQVMIKGKQNGSCKLLISHPKAAYTREVLIIVNGQLTNAIDASCYITTSQNYVRTKVGAAATELKISLRGGDDSDRNYFTWSVNSQAADGSNDKVIELQTTDGTVNYGSARAASYTYTNGTAYITPVKEGTAVITLNNPLVEYPTEVLVKVYSENAVLEDPLYFTGEGIITIVNGSTYNYSVNLNGSNKSTSDDSLISWECDNSNITVNANGNQAQITPRNNIGNSISWLTIQHPKADVSKKVLILTANSFEELAVMKALYSDKLYYNLEVGDEENILVNYYGFDTYDEEGNIDRFYDFTGIKWTVDEPSILYIEKSTYNPLLCKIKGLRSGTTKVRATIDSYSCVFEITVFPEGTVMISPEIYLTTAQNVVSLEKAGKTAKVNVSAVNLSASKYSQITWTISDSSIASVQDNGNNAVITALKEGEAIVTVSHPESQNSLKVYIRIGSEYIIQDSEPVVYISAPDVMTFLKDEQNKTLQAVLVNYSELNKAGFSFEIDKSEIASITAQSTNGIAYIKPVSSGQAEITITHPATELTKKVLIVVGNSAEELAGYKYLTTNSNVVAVGEGNTKSISVSVQNADNPVIDGYVWTSSNPGIVDVTASGATAVLTGNSIGTAMITVSNRECQYSLTIIAQCVNPIAAAANPYIQLTSSVQLLTVSPSYYSVVADLVGGKESDYSDFVWQSNDTSICMVYGQNEVGKIKALKAGTTYITVSHPKASYSAQLLVVCDDPISSECSISVSSSIIQIKPTDHPQTITATLVNGSSTDKYNFRWSMDVYDVIDLVYSANVCTITPKQTGTCTITISHPKSAYDQQIIVKVDEYTTFAFPSESFTTTMGEVNFLNMQVPTTNVTSHIEYSIKDSSKGSITGTKTIAQFSAISAGTTIVEAKLIATSTNTVLATAQMMVYIKEAPVNAVYISSTSTIYTVNKGKSQTLSAILSGMGVTPTDQYNLKWSTKDTDIISIAGISNDGTVIGQSVYITAKAPGEALITCSHEKAQSDLQFYIVVPGNGDKTVSLNKTYVTLLKGSSGTTITATIENSDSNIDYGSENLKWTAELVNGVEICRVMGNGKTVTIYPVSVGTTKVTAQLSNGSYASCDVVVEAGRSFTFEDNSTKVQPFQSRRVKYTVSPPDAELQWITANNSDYFSYSDLGHDANGVGYVEITGMTQGSATLYCLATSNAQQVKAQLNVRVAWDYSFNINTSAISGIPGIDSIIEYSNLNPSNSVISLDSTCKDLFDYSINETESGKGQIIIRPKTEIGQTFDIIITARNPVNDDIVGTRTVKAKFDYSTLTLKASLINSDGNFSHFESDYNILTIGDGEEIQMKFEIAEANANGEIKSVTWVPADSNDTSISIGEVSSSDTYSIQKIKHNEDYIEWQYRIIEAFMPTYKDENGTLIPISDFKNEFKIHTTYNFVTGTDRIGLWSKTFNTWYWNIDDDGKKFENKSFINTPNPNEKNKVYSVDDFEKIYWYVRPEASVCEAGKPARMSKEIQNCDYVYEGVPDTGIVEKQLSGNLVIIISHNGKEQKKIEIPVYMEKRKCMKDFRNE